MKTYLVEFQWLAPYPKNFDVRIEASQFSTASSRAIKIWKMKAVGRKRVKSFNLHITKL